MVEKQLGLWSPWTWCSGKAEDEMMWAWFPIFMSCQSPTHSDSFKKEIHCALVYLGLCDSDNQTCILMSTRNFEEGQKLVYLQTLLAKQGPSHVSLGCQVLGCQVLEYSSPLTCVPNLSAPFHPSLSVLENWIWLSPQSPVFHKYPQLGPFLILGSLNGVTWPLSPCCTVPFIPAFN